MQALKTFRLLLYTLLNSITLVVSLEDLLRTALPLLLNEFFMLPEKNGSMFI